MAEANSTEAAQSTGSPHWILGLDTSTEQAGIAVGDGDRHMVRSWAAGRAQTTSVLPAIDELLHEANITMLDVDAIAVATGPGTFTGLRVGVSLAKGLVMARDVPLIGIPTLDITAAGIEDPDEVIAVLPAGRGRVVWQQYGCEGQSQPRNTTVPELIEALAQMPDSVVTGELGDDHREMIERMHPRVRWKHRSSAELIGLARKRLEKGLVDDPVALEPIYLHGVTVGAGPVQDRLRRKE